DLSTGDLDRSLSGGYTYVAQVFGRKPVVAPAPNDDQRIKDTAQRVYVSLGAQMTLLYHEEGTDPNNPFEYVNGLLVRPSDFSVTRTTDINGTDDFWWDYMSAPDANKYNPTVLLQTQLTEWESLGYARAPFVTSLIHENNYYRGGAVGWSAIYYVMENSDATSPLSPPFDLSAPDLSLPRSAEEQSDIWTSYEEMVIYATAHLTVVTSEDIISLAQSEL
ncbi:MAG: hypothetical protein AAB266_03380, partial [Nitrospirota bacterium]